jgi:hypothetical protein
MKIGRECVDWIEMAWDRVQQWTLVNAELTSRFHKMQGTLDKLLASQGLQYYSTLDITERFTNIYLNL